MKVLNIRKWTAALLVLIILSSAGAPRTRADSSSEHTGEKIRIAFPQIKGMSETDRYGRRTGLVVDYLNEIAKYTGWNYEYVDTTNEGMVEGFLDNQFDLMGGTYYAPEFEQYFLYPDYSMGSSKATLLCRKEDSRIQSYNLQSINHMTIGVYDKATEKIRRLQEFLTIQGLECTLKYYTYKDMKGKDNLYQYLENGEVDLLLGNDLEMDHSFRIITSFDAQDYYIVASPQRQDLIDQINMALQKILESEPDFVQSSYERNFPDVKAADFQLNQEELNYIRNKGSVSVAVVDQWHPFYCVNRNQEHHRGLVVDVLEKISEKTGLAFTYLCADTYQEALEMVCDGRAEIMGGFLEGEEEAREYGLALSRSYATMNKVIVRNKSVTYPGDNLKGAVIKGEKMPPEITASQISYFPTVLDGLQAVEQGEVDFMYGLAASIELEIQQQHFVNIVPIALSGGSSEISFALARPITPELLTVLNKAIGNLAPEEQEDLLNQNMISIGSSAMTLKDLIYANPIAFMVILTVFLLLIVFSFLIFARIRMKNALIQAELEKAEAQSAARGEFLSRMSHEIRTPMNAIVGLADLTCMMEEVPKPVENNLRKIHSSSQYLLSLINDILDMSRIDKGMLEVSLDSFSMNSLIGEIRDMMEIQARQKEISFILETRVEHEALIGDPVRLRQVLVNLLSNAFKFTHQGGSVKLKIQELESDDASVQISFSVRDTGVGIAPEDQDRIFEAFEQVKANQSQSMGTGLGLPISRSIVRLMGGELKVESIPGEGSEFSFCLRFPQDQTDSDHSEEKGQAQDLAGVRILLAEDNELNAQIATQLLQMQGAEVDWVGNGQQAVETFINSLQGTYQVILMDIQMPVKNGLEAAREIRSSSHPDAEKIAILAMTANTFASDMQQAREAGMNGFVPKPVDLHKLYSAITEALHQSGSSENVK